MSRHYSKGAELQVCVHIHVCMSMYMSGGVFWGEGKGGNFSLLSPLKNTCTHLALEVMLVGIHVHEERLGNIFREL